MKDYGKFKKVYTNLVRHNRAAKEYEKMCLKEEFEVLVVKDHSYTEKNVPFAGIEKSLKAYMIKCVF